MFPVIIQPQTPTSMGSRKDIMLSSNIKPSSMNNGTASSSGNTKNIPATIKEDSASIMKRLAEASSSSNSSSLSKQQQRPLALNGSTSGRFANNNNNNSTTTLLSASGLLDESTKSNNSFSSLIPASPSNKKSGVETPKLAASVNNSSMLLSSLVLSTSTNSNVTSNTANNSSFSSTIPSATGLSASTYCCPKALRQQQMKPVNRSPFDPKMYLPLIPPARTSKKHQILLALDLDETLVHATSGDRISSSVNSPARKGGAASSLVTSVAGGPSTPTNSRVHDLIIRFDGTTTTSTTPKDGEQHTLQQQISTPTRRHGSSGRCETICVQFRPHTKAFLEFVTEHFEVMIFTASHRSYADPVVDALNALCGGALQGCTRLYREHCADLAGSKVKDLSLLGRPLHRVALLDNSPTSYYFQPRCGIPVESWFDDHLDDGLLRLCPMLERLASSLDVVDVLDEHNAIINSNGNNTSTSTAA